MHFGTSQPPKRTQSSTTCYCLGRPAYVPSLRSPWPAARALVASISKPLLIPIPRSPLPSYTQPKHPSQQRICSMTRYYRSSSNKSYPCCEYSPSEGRNIVAEQISVTISCIWPSMTSSTPKRRYGHHKLMESVSASIRLSCRSFIR